MIPTTEIRTKLPALRFYAFNPLQPRGGDGKWTHSGEAAAHAGLRQEARKNKLYSIAARHHAQQLGHETANAIAGGHDASDHLARMGKSITALRIQAYHARKKGDHETAAVRLAAANHYAQMRRGLKKHAKGKGDAPDMEAFGASHEAAAKAAHAQTVKDQQGHADLAAELEKEKGDVRGLPTPAGKEGPKNAVGQLFGHLANVHRALSAGDVHGALDHLHKASISANGIKSTVKQASTLKGAGKMIGQAASKALAEHAAAQNALKDTPEVAHQLEARKMADHAMTLPEGSPEREAALKARDTHQQLSNLHRAVRVGGTKDAGFYKTSHADIIKAMSHANADDATKASLGKASDSLRDLKTKIASREAAGSTKVRAGKISSADLSEWHNGQADAASQTAGPDGKPDDTSKKLAAAHEALSDGHARFAAGAAGQKKQLSEAGNTADAVRRAVEAGMKGSPAQVKQAGLLNASHKMLKERMADLSAKPAEPKPAPTPAPEPQPEPKVEPKPAEPEPKPAKPAKPAAGPSMQDHADNALTIAHSTKGAAHKTASHLHDAFKALDKGDSEAAKGHIKLAQGQIGKVQTNHPLNPNLHNALKTAQDAVKAPGTDAGVQQDSSGHDFAHPKFTAAEHRSVAKMVDDSQGKTVSHNYMLSDINKHLADAHDALDKGDTAGAQASFGKAKSRAAFGLNSLGSQSGPSHQAAIDYTQKGLKNLSDKLAPAPTPAPQPKPAKAPAKASGGLQSWFNDQATPHRMLLAQVASMKAKHGDSYDHEDFIKKGGISDPADQKKASDWVMKHGVKMANEAAAKAAPKPGTDHAFLAASMHDDAKAFKAQPDAANPSSPSGIAEHVHRMVGDAHEHLDQATKALAKGDKADAAAHLVRAQHQMSLVSSKSAKAQGPEFAAAHKLALKGITTVANGVGTTKPPSFTKDEMTRAKSTSDGHDSNARTLKDKGYITAGTATDHLSKSYESISKGDAKAAGLHAQNALDALNQGITPVGAQPMHDAIAQKAKGVLQHLDKYAPEALPKKA